MHIHVHRLILLLLLLACGVAFAQDQSGAGHAGMQFQNFSAAAGACQCSSLDVAGTTFINPPPGTGSAINNVSVNGVINVKAYGAVGNGIADDTGAIQAAHDAAGRQCVYFPAGTYLVSNDLNWTTTNNWCVYGDSPAASHIQCNNTGGNCFDASGTDAYTMRDIQLNGGTSAANAPRTVLLLARVSGAEGFGHTLTNVWTSSFGPYTIYDYGHEIAHWYDVRSNSSGVVISACNSFGVASRFHNLIAPPTSMSVVNIWGGNFNGGPTVTRCGIYFDNACNNGIIYAINIWGSFFGEMSNGGTGLCDVGTGTSFPGQTLEDIGIFGARLEASDPLPNYQYLNFARGPSYVNNLNMISDMMGVDSPQATPALQFGMVVGSRIALDSAPQATGVLTLTATQAYGNDIRGIPFSQMSPLFIWGPTDASGDPQGTGGNFISFFDGVAGRVDAGGAGANMPMTNLAGPTAGSVFWGMPMHAQSYKVVTLNFTGYQNNTATAQQIRYPVTFLTAPTSFGTCPAGLGLANGQLVQLPTAMAAPFNGQCIISGN